MHLNETKFLITLVLQNFAKKPDIMIVVLVSLDTIDDSHEPLDYQVFQPIFLVQIGVYVLLHCFSRLLAIFALLVKLNFLAIYIENCVSKLLDA